MSFDSSAIDNALLAKLGADTTLLGLMPDGVYWDVSPPGSKRFVIVSLVDSHDVVQFGGRAYEDVMYLVKAVGLSTMSPNMRAAAARIDELLDPQPPAVPATLTVPWYTFMAMYRDEDMPRIRMTEPSEDDPALTWFHRGGHYHVECSL